MRKFIPGIILTLVVLPIIGIGAALLGLINANADQAPSKAERWLSMRALDASVERRAPHDPNPVPVNDATLIEGMKTYVMACAECHGNLDKKPSQFGVELYPRAPQLIMHGVHDEEWQTFYVIKHGVRNTGMPAWKNLMSDIDIWKMTAFLSRVNNLPPAVQEEWNKMMQPH
jgi:mono/diheme cytochrome c family protein